MKVPCFTLVPANAAADEASAVDSQLSPAPSEEFRLALAPQSDPTKSEPIYVRAPGRSQCGYGRSCYKLQVMNHNRRNTTTQVTTHNKVEG